METKEGSKTLKDLADARDDSEDETEVDERVYASVYFLRDKFGIAYLKDEVLYLGSYHSNSFDEIERLKSQFEIITFITTSWDKKQFLEDNKSDITKPFKVIVSKKKDFSYKYAISNLSSIELEVGVCLPIKLFSFSRNYDLISIGYGSMFEFYPNRKRITFEVSEVKFPLFHI